MIPKAGTKYTATLAGIFGLCRQARTTGIFLMYDPQAAHVVGQAIGKLIDQQTAKYDELRRRESSQGKAHDVRKMNKLRQEIASLERRIVAAESAQDGLLRIAAKSLAPSGS